MLHAAGVASAAGVSRCHCLCRTPASRKASWHRVISCAGAAGLGGAMLRAADAMLRAAGAAGFVAVHRGRADDIAGKKKKKEEEE